MHIKQVTICGFKTYRDATTVSNFHEGYNVVGTCVSAVAASFPRACCIVSGCQLRGGGSPSLHALRRHRHAVFPLARYTAGRNGSGKSNFFDGAFRNGGKAPTPRGARGVRVMGRTPWLRGRFPLRRTGSRGVRGSCTPFRLAAVS